MSHAEALQIRESAANLAPDLYALLGEFSDVVSLLTIVLRSLEVQGVASVGDEAVALRHALQLLRAACRVFDEFISGLP